MAKLIYSAITSLDGYVADESGGIEWAEPDEEVRAFINDLERPIVTYLYGRRMYETMAYWESAQSAIEQTPVLREFAQIWKAADKIVFSKALESVSSSRTRIESNFDPERLRQLKEQTGGDMSIGGASLASGAIRAGLVDEWHFFVVPVLVGGGRRALPDGFNLELELLDERRFGNGTVFLHYRTKS
ncbi:MAG: dihydrofolate reductase family protein [Acidobacteriota bacterium]